MRMATNKKPAHKLNYQQYSRHDVNSLTKLVYKGEISTVVYLL